MKSKLPRQTAVRDQASIEHGEIYFEDVRQCSLEDDIATEILDDRNLTAIRVVSLKTDWQLRVQITSDTQVLEHIKIEMTLRKERRGELDHWYAYRRVLGTLHKRYVGHSENINEEKLLKVARSLPST